MEIKQNERTFTIIITESERRYLIDTLKVGAITATGLKFKDLLEEMKLV